MITRINKLSCSINKSSETTTTNLITVSDQDSKLEWFIPKVAIDKCSLNWVLLNFKEVVRNTYKP